MATNTNKAAQKSKLFENFQLPSVPPLKLPLTPTITKTQNLVPSSLGALNTRSTQDTQPLGLQKIEEITKEPLTLEQVMELDAEIIENLSAEQLTDVILYIRENAADLNKLVYAQKKEVPQEMRSRWLALGSNPHIKKDQALVQLIRHISNSIKDRNFQVQTDRIEQGFTEIKEDFDEIHQVSQKQLKELNELKANSDKQLNELKALREETNALKKQAKARNSTQHVNNGQTTKPNPPAPIQNGFKDHSPTNKSKKACNIIKFLSSIAGLYFPYLAIVYTKERHLTPYLNPQLKHSEPHKEKIIAAWQAFTQQFHTEYNHYLILSALRTGFIVGLILKAPLPGAGIGLVCGLAIKGGLWGYQHYKGN